MDASIALREMGNTVRIFKGYLKPAPMPSGSPMEWHQMVKIKKHAQHATDTNKIVIKPTHGNTPIIGYTAYAAWSIGLGSVIFSGLFLIGMVLATLFINGLFHWFILFTPLAALLYATLASIAVLFVKTCRFTASTAIFILFISNLLIFFICSTGGVLLFLSNKDPAMWFTMSMVIALCAAIQAPFYRRFLPAA